MMNKPNHHEDLQKTSHDASDLPNPAPTETSKAEEATYVSQQQETISTSSNLLAQAPQRIGHFEINGILGEGGMGIVYRAHDTKLGRDVAFKTIRQTMRQHDLKVRLNREARLLAQLDHPHIVRILDLGEDDNRTWLAMELLPGKTLADQLGSGPTDPQKAAEIVLQIAQAVGYCHTAGIIHRDLKPANVLVAENGQYKVTDFGLGRSTTQESRLTRSGDVMGTLQYMAPEQATGAVKRIRPTSDVYSLGVMLYELLTGRQPFSDEDPLRMITLILSEDPLPPRKLRANIPSQLELICMKCLEKSPPDRYEDANQLAADLQRYLNNAEIEARPASPVQRVARWAKRHPVLTVATALTFLFLFSGVLMLSAHNRQLQASLDRSNRLVDRGRNLSNWLLYDFTETLEDPHGLTVIRTQLVDRIVTYLDETATDAQANHQLRLDQAKAYVQVANLQGNPQTFNLGMPEAALKSLDQAERLLDVPHEDAELAVRGKILRVIIYEVRGDIAMSFGERAQADQRYQQGLDLLKELDAKSEGDENQRNQLRARLLAGKADVELDEQHFDRAVQLADDAMASLPSDLPVSDYLNLYLRLESIRAQSLDAAGKHQQALKVWQELIDRLEGLSDDPAAPVSPSTHQPLVVAVLGKAGLLAKLRQFDDAQSCYERALKLNAQMIQRDQMNRMLKRQRTIVLRDLVTLHLAQGRVNQENHDRLVEAVELLRQLAKGAAENRTALEDLLSGVGLLGSYHVLSNQPDLAEQAFVEQKQLAEKLISMDHATPMVRQAHAESELGLGNADSLRMSAAAERAIQAEANGQPLPDEDPNDFAEQAIEHFLRSTQLFEVLKQKHGLTESQKKNAKSAAELLELHRQLLPEEV